ncbi:cysteine hydrolase family protein [Pseudomonas asplenii]|uniref:cysteine hydrolase family protein n=1 Tax=Pseudomonas asplenii TaxID=53407 RepID=UPI0006B44968|nr:MULTISPECIES: cysteine hydrolase family protein [Pseudomonas]KPA94200.1 nicotinamidase-like amidase [Pseudomonas fuscovaginae]
MQVHSSQRSALLIIDMQVGLFHGPDKPWDGEQVLARITALVGQARESCAPIFALRHTGPQGSPIEAGSAAWQVLPELGLDPAADHLLDKTRPSCFFETGLAEQLDDAGVKRLVIVGMKTQYCVDSTCRLARDLGFEAVLVGDAHTCMDTPGLSARAIVEHHNATLNGAFVQVMKAADVSF